MFAIEFSVLLLLLLLLVVRLVVFKKKQEKKKENVVFFLVLYTHTSKERHTKLYKHMNERNKNAHNQFLSNS